MSDAVHLCPRTLHIDDGDFWLIVALREIKSDVAWKVGALLRCCICKHAARCNSLLIASECISVLIILFNEAESSFRSAGCPQEVRCELGEGGSRKVRGRSVATV